MRRLRLFAAPAILFGAACSNEQPVTPLQAGRTTFSPSFASASRAVRDVPAVRIDRPAALRTWDTSATALADAISKGENYAMIAIKESGVGRSLETGIRASVAASALSSAVAMLNQAGFETVELLENVGIVRVRGNPTAIAALRNQPWVDFIEPRQYGRIAAQETPWGISMVKAPEAWPTSTGSGAKILIIDTGHQQGHEDWPSVPSANCAGVYGGCDDGNGHGTHVGGIALARNNTIGVVGVAQGIAAADVFVYGACNDAGGCPTDEVTAGINAAIFTAHVISMSLVQVYDAAQASAVAQAWANNIVLVAAAGNNEGNTERYPAKYTNVLGVSGVNEDKSFANPAPCGSSSNWGAHVDIAAPFTANSTLPTNTHGVLCGHRWPRRTFQAQPPWSAPRIQRGPILRSSPGSSPRRRIAERLARTSILVGAS